MSKRDSAYSITKGILEGIGGNPNLPYDSTYKVVREIYTHLVGDSTTDFDSTYAIVLAILDGIESGSISPGTPASGTLAITKNGEYNVAIYATASVNVQGGGTIETDFSKIPLSFKCVQAGTLVGKDLTNVGGNDKTVYYSLDGGATWAVFNDQVTLNLEVGDIITIGANWGAGGFGDDMTWSPIIGILSTAAVDVFGNIDTLINKEDFTNVQTLTPYSGQYTFKNLFRSCGNIRNCYDLVLPCLNTSLNSQKSTYGGMFRESSITVAPKEIPATTLGYESCLEMFMGCTNLTRGTKIWATRFKNNYNIAHMYEGCVNLVDVPNFEEVVEVSQGTFEKVFYQCSRLTSAPAFPLVANILGLYKLCDSMFAETAIKSAPYLPYTGSVDNGQYFEMFKDCTSLEYVPEIPAEGLVGVWSFSMFQGCTHLKSVTLQAKTASVVALKGMFTGCSNLERVNIPNLQSVDTTGGFTNWLSQVSSSGVLNVNTSLTQDYLPTGSVDGVPSGWRTVAERSWTIPAA